MPTGYTHKIKDGITFRQFAMMCARAMGATIMMRDEPLDAPIPERFEPSDYHTKALEVARKNLASYQAMSEQEIEVECQKEFGLACEAHQKRLDEANDLHAKYSAMLDEVEAWTPPTTEHEGIKKFMIDQIKGSIGSDCNMSWDRAPELQSPSSWLAAKLAAVEKAIEYHVGEQEKEVRRTEGRNEWLRAFRESLSGQVKA